MSALRAFIPSAAFLAAGLLACTALALPERAAAAPGLNPAKSGAATRRQSVSSVSSARGTTLKPIPVKLPNRQPGELSLSRHLTRVSEPKGLGKVVETKPLTQAERDFNTGKGYSTLYSTQLRKLDHYPGSRNGLYGRQSLHSELRRKMNTEKVEARAASNRSATRVTRTTGQHQTEAPSNWRQRPPMPAELRRGIAAGVALKPIPVKLPNRQPGELSLSRHLTRVYQPKGLGKVVETKPLTQAERDFNTGKGYSTLYSTQLRKLGHYMDTRIGFISRRGLHSELQVKVNAAKAEARAASGRSATSVSHRTQSSASSASGG